jgi:hypothetical protein
VGTASQQIWHSTRESGGGDGDDEAGGDEAAEVEVEPAVELDAITE